jgi:SET domain-containing protein
VRFTLISIVIANTVCSPTKFCCCQSASDEEAYYSSKSCDNYCALDYESLIQFKQKFPRKFGSFDVVAHRDQGV